MYFIPGNSLSPSGYHLCIRNETRTLSFQGVHKVPYTVTKPCGWLLWTTCTVTLYRIEYQTEYKTVMEEVTRCCNGYVQVGHYCALRECAAHHFSFTGLGNYRRAQIVLLVVGVLHKCFYKIWWYGITCCRQTSHQHDLSVCGTVCKTPDGSIETAQLQISCC